MAKAAALHAALLLLFLLPALAAATYPSLPSLSGSDDVLSACNYVTVPALCTSLVTRTSAATVRDLTLASIKEAASSAAGALGMVESAKAEAAADEKVRTCLDVCSKGFAQAAESLQQAADDAEAGDVRGGRADSNAYRRAVRNVSSAVNYVGTCNDVFSENPGLAGLASPVADITSILKKLVSNSLALSMALEVQAKKGLAS